MRLIQIKGITMKKIFCLMSVLFLSGGMALLFPCDISFETAQVVESGKSKVNVKVLVEIVHGNCPLNIEKTGLLLNGLTVEKRGPWKKIDEYTWQLELKVVLNDKKPGEIRVVRDCSKKGLHQQTLRIDPL
jgi:hypothetical protein